MQVREIDGQRQRAEVREQQEKKQWDEEKKLATLHQVCLLPALKR